jgi:hypothetical protein
MQDHEQALIDAIARLADLSDGDSGNSYPHFAHIFALLQYHMTFVLSYIVL